MAGLVQQAPKKTMADRLTVELRAQRGGVLPGQKLREESIAEEVAVVAARCARR